MRRLDTFWSSDVINFAWVAAVSNSGKISHCKNYELLLPKLEDVEGKSGFYMYVVAQANANQIKAEMHFQFKSKVVES